MRQTAVHETLYLYLCPRCQSENLTVRKPNCYCHDCGYKFDVDDAVIFEPED